MIERLYIKDFAIIKELYIDFGPYLNIITGETGAGKSIILGALNVVLGGKVSQDHVRAFSIKAIVEATFSIESQVNTHTCNLLEENGIDCSEKILIIRREVNKEGRSKVFMNNQQVSLAFLKEASRNLVDIHGQNEHQNILNLNTHRSILDRYANLQKEVEHIRSLHTQHSDLSNKLEQYTLDEREKVRRIEMLQHEINEIESANLEDNSELENLIKEEKVLINAEKMIKDLGSVSHGLSDPDEGVLLSLNKMSSLLDNYADLDTDISEHIESFREAHLMLQEVGSSLRQASSRISLDHERLQIVRERSDLLNSLLRKYAPSISEVKEYLEKSKKDLTSINMSSEEEEKMRDKVQTLKEDLIKIATNLSNQRKQHARQLEDAVNKELQELGMQDTKLKLSMKWMYGDKGLYIVKNSDRKYIIYSTGLEVIEFFLQSIHNPKPRALRKIASGGEMSRIMLAFKKVIVSTDPVQTMVFDEVDVGVGGRIAEAVGHKLATLAKNSQVFVITHLHQVASLSSKDVRHFKVEKTESEGTRIILLNTTAREKELARMLSGNKITDVALEHAKTILKEKQKDI